MSPCELVWNLLSTRLTNIYSKSLSHSHRILSLCCFIVIIHLKFVWLDITHYFNMSGTFCQLIFIWNINFFQLESIWKFQQPAIEVHLQNIMKIMACKGQWQRPPSSMLLTTHGPLEVLCSTSYRSHSALWSNLDPSMLFSKMNMNDFIRCRPKSQCATFLSFL